MKKKRFRLVRARCQSGLRTVDVSKRTSSSPATLLPGEGQFLLAVAHFMLNQHEQASEMF